MKHAKPKQGCAFCAGKPVVKKWPKSLPEIERPYWTVTCSHDTSSHHKAGTACPCSPMAIGDTREEAVAKWDTRSFGGAK